MQKLQTQNCYPYCLYLKNDTHKKPFGYLPAHRAGNSLASVTMSKFSGGGFLKSSKFLAYLAHIFATEKTENSIFSNLITTDKLIMCLIMATPVDSNMYHIMQTLTV